MSEPRPRVLIVSSSGRALACSARRAGWTPLVLDLFNDQDTCELAEACRRVDFDRGGWSPASLHSAVAALDPQGSASLAYGSGLEAMPQSIDTLAGGRTLLGNPPALVARLKDPTRLAELLAQLSIPHPEVRRQPPPEGREWLRKTVGGCGGTHVIPVDAHDPESGDRHYFQRRVHGRLVGVTLLAGAEAARIVGYAEQLLHGADPSRPFLYGGAVALESGCLPAEIRTSVEEAVRALVKATGLRGLCGVDLIEDGHRWWLIDVNPRPGASFELHERKQSLFAAHARAFRGGGIRFDPACFGASMGLMVVYAAGSFTVPDRPEWPVWVRDRPWPGTHLVSGEPVCTVAASAENSGTVRALLQRRHRQMSDRLEVWQEDRASHLRSV